MRAQQAIMAGRIWILIKKKKARGTSNQSQNSSSDRNLILEG